MAYLAEAAGKDMQEETPDKFRCGDGHGFYLVSVSVIPPEEGNSAVLQAENAVVGDCHPVGIASQIGDDLFSAAERRLAVNHPLFL